MASVSYTECCRASWEYRTETVEGIFWAAGTMVEVDYRVCASCGARSPKMVYIQTRNAKSGRKTECGSACLSGKVSCDCRCKGRCHGNNKCLCREVAA